VKISVLQLFISLPFNRRFTGSKQAEVDSFLSAIKNHSTTSFGREVKPRVPQSTFSACKEPVT
jgi:hypothetical protein